MRKLILVIILLIPKFLLAQKKEENQQLIWYGCYNSLKFNENWNLTSENQEPIFITEIF